MVMSPMTYGAKFHRKVGKLGKSVKKIRLFSIVSRDARISLERSVGHVKGLSSHDKTKLDSFIRFHRSPTCDGENSVAMSSKLVDTPTTVYASWLDENSLLLLHVRNPLTLVLRFILD